MTRFIKNNVLRLSPDIQFQTPYNICEYMASLIPENTKTIYEPNQIIIFEDDDIVICELHRDSSPISYLKDVFLTHRQRVWLSKKEVNTQAIAGAVLTAAYLFYFFIGALL